METNTIVKLTTDEYNEISTIYDRIASLNNLIVLFAERKEILDENNYLYENILSDLDKANVEYNAWWKKMIIKYNISEIDAQNLIVDFKNETINRM